MAQRQPGCLEHRIHKPVPLLSGCTFVARVIQLEPKERTHCHGVAQEEVHMLAVDAVSVALVLVRANHEEHICKVHLGAHGGPMSNR